MHRLCLSAICLELLVVALLPVIGNRRETATVDSTLEAQPSLRRLTDEHRLAARRQATVAFRTPISECLSSLVRPAVAIPPLSVARNDVERAPFAAQGIDECPQAHCPSL